MIQVTLISGIQTPTWLRLQWYLEIPFENLWKCGQLTFIIGFFFFNNKCNMFLQENKCLESKLLMCVSWEGWREVANSDLATLVAVSPSAAKCKVFSYFY